MSARTPRPARRPAAGPTGPLPAFVEPMLAKPVAAPFDGGPDWLFEVKWDGFRALARVDGAGCRLTGRRRTDFTARFPALAAALARLPPGTMLDGEVVALRPDGTQDFAALLRGGGRGPPLAYVAFDLLYAGGRNVMREPCAARRDRLRPLVAALADRRVVMSEGVVGGGVGYFDRAVAAGLEGVVAKRLDAPYRPGSRGGDWLKVKARRALLAVVVGYEPAADGGLKSLVIAAAGDDGGLRCAGRVGSGIGPAQGAELLRSLRAIERPTPAVACPGVRGRWVEPRLLCRVSYAEVLETGRLRQPVFESVVNAGGRPR